MNLEDITGPLVQLVAAVLLAIGVSLTRRLADWLKLSADDRVRGYLQEAMENAITHGVTRAAQLGDATATSALTHAARYVEGRVPDALKRLGIDQPGLDHLLAVRLQRRAEGQDTQ
jgi:hypothetical protein